MCAQTGSERQTLCHSACIVYTLISWRLHARGTGARLFCRRGKHALLSDPLPLPRSIKSLTTPDSFQRTRGAYPHFRLRCRRLRRLYGRISGACSPAG